MADAEKKFSRDEIRAAILNSGADDEIVQFGDVKVAVRTPCLEDLLQYKDAQNDDYAMARAIVGNVFVPGTDERVFAETDLEVLMKAKFSQDMKRLNQAIMRMLGGDEELIKAVDNDTKSNSE